MKRVVLMLVLTTFTTVSAACAALSPSVAATPTGPLSSPPMPAMTPPAEPIATVIPATDTSMAGSTRVEVNLVDNTVVSSLTSFKAGQSYLFVVSNRGRHEHNFIISPPVSVAGGYGQALSQALLAVDETQLYPGSTVSVEFTFPTSAVGATLELNCLIRRHYEDGMRLPITVTG